MTRKVLGYCGVPVSDKRFAKLAGKPSKGDVDVGSHAHGVPVRPKGAVIEDAVAEARAMRDAANWTRCAVVGSGADLKGSKLGEFIDSHDAVFRFNDAPAKKFARDVGRKTTLRIQNIETCGYSEGPGEMCLGYSRRAMGCPSWKKCTPFLASPLERKFVEHYWDSSRPPKTLVNKDTACTKTHRGDKLIPKDKAQCDRRISAGFYGVLLSLHLCTKVYILGFGGDAHYYPHKRSGNVDKPWGVRHHWTLERNCLTRLGRGAAGDAVQRWVKGKGDKPTKPTA